MRNLTFKELSEKNRTRVERWHSLNSWSLSDWGVAAAGEMGEACNIIKKLNRERDAMQHGSRSNLDALGMEIADTIIYLDLLAQRCGISLEEFITRKFNIVSEREGFPERL